MTSQEQIPASLPDTQNADVLTLTQSQETSSQPTQIWGRLCPIRSSLKVLEMTKDDKVYSVGRSESCDCILTTQEMKLKWLSVISKVHFRIYKERISNTNETVVYLEDMSQNGTFVDKVKVGRGNRVIIESFSEIALANVNFSVYKFININLPEANELPPELKMKYALGRRLGAGACGEVRLVFTKNDSQRFAMKIIKKNNFGENGNQFNDPEKIRNEVEILRKLEHPHVIRMEDICDTPSAMYIVLELMEGGELFDKIRNKGRLSESCAKLIFYQVVSAVDYLHMKGITHRDLKPENILLASNSDYTVVKVSDFGMSKLVHAENMMKTFCGTPMYLAPEILATLGRTAYTNKVDVWSLGVILYTCLSGSVPFNINNRDVTLEVQIRHGLYRFPTSLFNHVSKDAILLIKRMLTVNPMKRISVKTILVHVWLNDPNMQNTLNRLISQPENDENMPPLNMTRNRQEADLFPEYVKRARLNA